MYNKLQLQHLAPYLPYGLKYYPYENSELFKTAFIDNSEYSLWGYEQALKHNDAFALKLKNSYIIQNEPFITNEDGELYLGNFTSSLGFDVDNVYASDVMPMLRPMNTFDLIDNNLNKQTDFDDFLFGSHGEAHCIKKTDKIYISHMLTVLDFLFENHFDVFNLIDMGLAKNINII